MGHAERPSPAGRLADIETAQREAWAAYDAADKGNRQAVRQAVDSLIEPGPYGG